MAFAEAGGAVFRYAGGGGMFSAFWHSAEQDMARAESLGVGIAIGLPARD